MVYPELLSSAKLISLVFLDENESVLDVVVPVPLVFQLCPKKQDRFINTTKACFVFKAT
jgi:hypothetical protein